MEPNEEQAFNGLTSTVGSLDQLASLVDASFDVISPQIARVVEDHRKELLKNSPVFFLKPEAQFHR